MNRATFETTYTDPTTGTFANNSTRLISEADMQQFAQDISDTFASIADDLGNVETIVVEIGDWDMDASDNVTVDLGFTSQAGKFRMVGVVIRADNASGDTNAYAFPFISSAGNIDAWWTIVDQNIGTNHTITLYRRTGGTFDSTTFNATSFNRGWITIIKTP